MPDWIITCPDLALSETVHARDFATAMPFASDFADRHKLRTVPGTGMLRGPGHEEYIWEVELPLPVIPSLWNAFREYSRKREIEQEGRMVAFRAFSPSVAFTVALNEWWSAVRSRWEDPPRGRLILIMVTDFWRYPVKGYADED